ncbi:MAG: dipicolinate synthase subunit B [Eubacteriales bacterium]|jgi:dipicolinate synthase subunit B|nr:dipicolinate synthase subunit B [Eubacteriales bacterium]
MNIKDIKDIEKNNIKSLAIGWGICGSFCTIDDAIEATEKLMTELPPESTVIPVVSFNVKNIDTRFGKAAGIIARVEQLCGRSCIDTIEGAEPLGPEQSLDVFIISPCTGNTLAKIAGGVNDTPVTMAVKACLRNDRPVVAALATNDALSANLHNIATLLQRKHFFFVPLGQDVPQQKPHSMVADLSLLYPAVISALEGKQLQPLLLRA